MSWDEAFFRAINTLTGQVAVLDHALIALGRPSTFYVPFALTVCYWLWVNVREAMMGGAALAGVIGIVDAVGAQLKHLAQRPRPCLAMPDIIVLEQPCGGLYSFPSNHAVNTAAAAAFLHILYPKSGWVSWPLAGLIGLSRVYVGAHYVTDVLGAWVIGGLLGAGAAWLFLRYARDRAPREHPAV
jgi:undecaprenyl-diphosphatase